MTQNLAWAADLLVRQVQSKFICLTKYNEVNKYGQFYFKVSFFEKKKVGEEGKKTSI